MAFERRDLVELASAGTGVGTTGGQRFFRLWAYATDDTVAAVTTAGYFAAAGSATGDGKLSEGDLIYVQADLDGTPAFGLYRVSDAAAGTVVAL
ncbi:MAG: hypothetical protein D6816_17015 [Bacteroidetes bacterium]|nr:MAG: hypothetical protein D6816_17015 [Bacteroidota bacterium]